MLTPMLNMFPRIVDTVSHDRLWRDVNRLLSATAMPVAERPTERWPGLNAWRDGERFVVEAEIPGFRMEDIEILATDDTITLRGQRNESTPEGATPLRMERSVRSFERTLRLPTPIDPETVEATLTDGVLRITMPVAPSARPRRVEIRPASVPAT